jgi:UDP-glucose 4-epimerase
MKAVVFGGSGFLGGHVADALCSAGYDVTVFDIKSPVTVTSPRSVILGDVLDEEKVLKTVLGSDIVYNFAGIADIGEAGKKPLESVKTNILGNTVILEACRKAAVKRFVFASSLYVYSRTGSFYRSTKHACELLIENYNEVFGLPYTILRYGSLYGPRSDEKNFIHRILKQALTERKITREGDGEEIREYIHVQDAARYSVEILSQEFANSYVIITGNQQMKVKDLLTMIKEILNNKIVIEFIAPTDNFHYEITPYNFSPRLAKRIVGKTYVDLGQGVLNCIDEIYGDLGHAASYDDLLVENGNESAGR